MDASHWLAAAIAAVISAIAGSGLGVWLLKAYQAWHGGRRTDKKDAWDRQAELIERLDKHMEKLQNEQQRAFTAEAVCRQEVARLRTMGRWLYDLLVKHHVALEKLDSQHVEPLPDFPDFDSPSLYDTDREFRQRETEHTTQLVREQAQQMKEEGQP